MVTQQEHDNLVERVVSLEVTVTAGIPAEVAAQLSILRSVVAGNPSEELRLYGLRVIDRIENRMRPLGLSLERAARIVEDRAQLLDDVAPRA